MISFPVKNAKEATARIASPVPGLESSVNDSAKSTSILWISFILFSSYLILSTGVLTPSSLFLGSGIQIPIIGIIVDLGAYAIISPVLVCLFGIYVYMQIDCFTQKASLYNDAIRVEYPGRALREKKRGALDLFPFLQLVAGSDDRRCFGILLAGIAWISLFLIPAAFILILQIKMLPFHSEFVTWCSRVSLAILCLSFLFVFLRLLIRTKFGWIVNAVLLMFSSAIAAAALVFAFAIAVFPGEVIYGNQISESLSLPGSSNEQPLYKTLFEGEFDLATAARKSLFSNTLIVTPTAEVQEAIKKIGAAFVRGRDFREAAFVGLDLRKADFSGAMLSGALFYRTDLREAHFDCLSLSDPTAYSNTNLNAEGGAWPDGCSWLHGVVVLLSNLEGASFYGARARWATFEYSSLQGAYFDNANMQAVTFGFDDLTAASFQESRLSASVFVFGNLSAVNFSRAWMSGVHLGASKLNGLLMLDTHVRGFEIEDSSTRFASSALQPIVADDDIFEKKDGADYLLWRSKISNDMPGPKLLPRLFDITLPSLDGLSVDAAAPLATEKASWERADGFISWGKPVRSEDLTRYSDAAVAIACSSNGSPYVARAIFGYNRPLLNRVATALLFDLGNVVLPSLYDAVERIKRESLSCPGLKEILDAWPIETKLPNVPKESRSGVKPDTPTSADTPTR